MPVLSPLLVTVLGASGAAWITGLKPWAPYLLAGAFFLLLHAFWSLRRSRRCRADGEGRASQWQRTLDRGTAALLAVATVVWVASIAAYFFLS